MDKIIIKNAGEHNLKNINLELPKNKLIVFTGISGSGKSTLAFDTIYAEAERRYLESMSSYARQFLPQMKKAKVESIEGLSPAISISQKSISHNPRSTVGTVTEIYDYLRLLFARIGRLTCPECGKEIRRLTKEEIVDKIIEFAKDKKVRIFSPVARERKGEYLKLLDNLYKQGFSMAKIDGKMTKIDSKIELSRRRKHSISVLVDEFKIQDEELDRIFEAVENSLKISGGLVLVERDNEETLLSSKHACPHCDFSFPEIEPRLFSFNSPQGACPNCQGLGTLSEIDPELVIPDKSSTISQGAILPWTWQEKNYYGALLRAICEAYGISQVTRIKDLKKEQIDLILRGPVTPERIKIRSQFHSRSRVFYTDFEGLIPHLKKRLNQTESTAVRREMEKYVNSSICEACQGKRLKSEALAVNIGGKDISQISAFSIKSAQSFFENLDISAREKLIAERILREIKVRLNFLTNVGLEYLTLDRKAETLSSGEGQRIRLASQIGSGLTGVLYILDEPSVGLHMRDNSKLLKTLEHLRDLGNTVIVVEHDEETIRRADWVVDIGPGAGRFGGEIVAQGIIPDILKSDSLTAQYLNKKKFIPLPEKRREAKNGFLSLFGAKEHNLKDITVHFPLKTFICLTGVSGSGKSTLLCDILWPTLARKYQNAKLKPGKFNEIKGAENLDRIFLVSQSPIGRTPRSNPATYTGLLTPIRELFAKTQEARIRGYSPSRFSFNVEGGRCETCQGQGWQRIEMQFLPDVYLPCEACDGKRYHRETLEIEYKGKNIAEILKMPVQEAMIFFKNIPQVFESLKVLDEIGLGYIELGQPATTLSGGEAQRVKLANELAKRTRGKTLYILDEPTTGLHFNDIKKLIHIINQLVSSGNTVIVIEHNLDVIKSADWIIDLGPEGGERGGEIIAQGTPEEIANNLYSRTGQFLGTVLR